MRTKDWYELDRRYATRTEIDMASADIDSLRGAFGSLKQRVEALEIAACDHEYRLVDRTWGRFEQLYYYHSSGLSGMSGRADAGHRWVKPFSRWCCIKCGHELSLGYDEKPEGC